MVEEDETEDIVICMSNLESKRKIERILASVGLLENEYFIGNGALDKHSEVHFNLDKRKTLIGCEVRYALQYSEDIVAIWEVQKRIEKNASLNLYFKGLYWKEVDGIYQDEVGIKGTDDSTSVGVMPIECLGAYMRAYGFDNEQERYYLHVGICSGVEGKKIRIYTSCYERDPRIRQATIEFHGTTCMVCGISFAEKYGDYAEGIIEVHHIKPLFEGEQKPDPKTDLVCVCPNCHTVIHHKRNRVLTIEEVKKMIKERKFFIEKEK